MAYNRIEYQRAWREANPDKVRAYYLSRDRKTENARSRAWARANPEKVAAQKARNKHKRKAQARKSFLKCTYGLTEDQWSAMFEAQGRACGCCGSLTSRSKRPWHTDHCHASGKVRGILCQPCNSMLGMAKDDPEILARGIAYLRASKLSEK